MIEILESRVVPATLIWTGAASGLWSNAANWLGGAAPAAGDTLVFSGATNFTVNNDSGAGPYALKFGGLATWSVIGGGVSLLGSGLVESGPGAVLLGIGLSGGGGIHLSAGTLALSKASTFSGGTEIAGGTLQIQAENNLGAAASSVTILNGGTLATSATISTARNFSLSGSATFAIPAGLSLGIHGIVSDGATPGSIILTGGGALVLTNAANSYTGSYTMPAGKVTLKGVTTTLTGPGTASITQVPGSADIASIVLSDTTLASKLLVRGPVAPHVYKITSADPNDHIATIQLGSNVVFGDGVADSSADLFFAGKVNNILFSDIEPAAIFRLGSGLPYDVAADSTTPDSYNNNPLVTLRDIRGPGVTIDVTGDGTPGGIGGGGLGKMVARSWAYPGIVKTTQSIDTVFIETGDALVTLEVDKFHNGALTIANVNQITVLAGKWNSIGTAIEGYVDRFDVGGFATAATLNAGYIKTSFLVRGSYPDPGNIALGGTITLEAASPSEKFDIRIGTFTGTVTAKGTIRSFTVASSYSGQLTAAAVLEKVQALDFANGIRDALIKTTTGGIASVLATGGGMAFTSLPSAANIGPITLTGSGSTIAAVGSIGAIKIGTPGTGANLLSSKILAGAALGASGTVGGGDDTWFAGKSIGDISIYGVMSSSIIAASIDPGSDSAFGNTSSPGADIALGGGGTIGKVSLQSTAFTGKTIATTAAPIAHTNAVLGGSIEGVFQLTATNKIAATILTAAKAARDLRTGIGEAASDLLFYAF